MNGTEWGTRPPHHVIDHKIQNGPASAPTLPSHGLPPSTQDKDQNDMGNSIPDDAMQITAGVGVLMFAVADKKLRKFTVRELHGLRDAAFMMADVLSGIMCQPRYLQGDTHFLNAPGDVLDHLHDLLMQIVDDCEDEVEERKDLKGPEALLRAFMLMAARANRQDLSGTSDDTPFRDLLATAEAA